MAAKQDDDDMDDITDEVEDGDDIESLLQSMETNGNLSTSNLTARRRIEDLLEERRLREQIGDYYDMEL